MGTEGASLRERQEKGRPKNQGGHTSQQLRICLLSACCPSIICDSTPFPFWCVPIQNASYVIAPPTPEGWGEIPSLEEGRGRTPPEKQRVSRWGGGHPGEGCPLDASRREITRIILQVKYFSTIQSWKGLGAGFRCCL